MSACEIISIILPTYNGQKYLPQLLESLLNQTYRNYEILVIDDFSTDDTVKILEQYASSDDRIKLMKNEFNLGINANFEKGINQAKGTYIFLCDQDDIWEGDKVQRMASFLENGFDLVYCDLRVIDANNQLISSSFHKLIGTLNINTNNLSRYLLFRNVTNGCSTAFKREIRDEVLPFPDFMIYDWWLLLKTAQRYKVGRIKEPLMSYRIHDNNAVGFSVSEKNRPTFIRELNGAIGRLHDLQPFLDVKLIPSYEKTLSYYRSRLNYFNHELSSITYFYQSLSYLVLFPGWYKNIIKNFVDDCFPWIAKLLMARWQKVNMRKT